MANSGLTDFQMDELWRAFAETMSEDVIGARSGLIDTLLNDGPIHESLKVKVLKERGLVETFEDPDFPLATVKVLSSVRGYIVLVQGRQMEPEQSLTAAKINAAEIHKKLLAALVADREQFQPNYGRF